MVRVGRRIFSTIKKSWDNFVPKIGEIGLVNVSPCARQWFGEETVPETEGDGVVLPIPINIAR